MFACCGSGTSGSTHPQQSVDDYKKQLQSRVRTLHYKAEQLFQEAKEEELRAQQYAERQDRNGVKAAIIRRKQLIAQQGTELAHKETLQQALDALERAISNAIQADHLKLGASHIQRHLLAVDMVNLDEIRELVQRSEESIPIVVNVDEQEIDDLLDHLPSVPTHGLKVETIPTKNRVLA